jgi:hypothetical protein
MPRVSSSSLAVQDRVGARRVNIRRVQQKLRDAGVDI